MKPRGILLLVGLATIWCVTAYDVFCCQWLEPRFELNPVARVLLIWGGVWTLVAWKIVGTFIATEMLRCLHRGYLIGVTAFEICLFCFLRFA